MKNSFVFYTEWIEQIRLLEENGTQEDLEAFWAALRAFVEEGDGEAGTAMAKLALAPMRNQIARDTAKYEETSQKRKEAVKKRWDANDSKTIQEDTKVYKSIQKHTNDTVDEDDDVDDDVSPNGDIVEGAEALIDIPLARGKIFHVTQEIYNMLAECYPAVNTMEQLRKMKAWSISNPKRRKVDGMKFANNWFSYEQDKHHPVARSGTTKTMTAEEIINLPSFNPWTEAAQ